MHLLSFIKTNKVLPALQKDDFIIDLSLIDNKLPTSTKAILQNFDSLNKVLQSIIDNPPDHSIIPIEKVNYTLPISPSKIICVGLNYLDHAKETKKELPTYPVFFARFLNSIVGHNQSLICPMESEKYDFEGELAVIIGKQCSKVKKENADDYIAGYSIFNDGTIRDYQAKSPQWLIGKNFDSTGSFGPTIVTKEELPYGAKGLKIQTYLNNQLMQNGTTEDMIFDVHTLIEVISQAITLNAGDIIVTGTPAGVGYARTPPVYMKDGDECKINIQGIGTLINRISKAKGKNE